MKDRDQLNTASRKRPGNKSRAQAMLEFALALPVLLAVVYGLIESGRAVFMYASVATAARQAARYGSATGDNGSGTLYYNDCDGIRTAAKRIGFLQTFSDADIGILYDHGPGGAVIASTCTGSVAVANGDRIVVTISTQYSPIVPLVQFQPVTFTSSSARTLLLGASIAVDPDAVGPPSAGGGSLILDKFCTPTNYDQIGDVISYTFTLTNPGSNPVTGLSIVDPTIPGFSCTGLTDPLAGGGATTGCSATYTIGANDITNESVQNTATATGISGSTVISATDTCDVSYTPLPKLTLTKTGVPPETIAAGQPVNYTFTLLNNGNVSLAGPYTVSDSPITSWNCPTEPTELVVGDTVTCTGYYTLKNNDISPDPLVNTATATAKFGAATITSNVATASVPVPPLFLSITAEPSSVSEPGPVTFTYHIHNPGTSVLRNITVTDNRGATNLDCVGSLAPGATDDTCTHVYNVTQADLDSPAGFFVNVGSAVAQGNRRSNTATVNVDIDQRLGLTLTKTAAPSEPTPPDIEFPSPQSITYTYTLENTGNVTLQGPYVVTDDKLTGITCPTGSLAPAGTKTCTAAHALTAADRAAGSLINHATATALFGAQIVTSDPATATVITYAAPRLSLTKTANPPYYTAASSSITYSFVLRNTGNLPLTVSSPYTLTDTTGTKVASVACPALTVGTVLELGASKTCDSYTYGLTGDDVSASSVQNTVTASAGSTDPVTISPSTSLTVLRFGCDGTLTLGTGTQDDNTFTWPINNTGGVPVHLDSLTVNWNPAGSTNLTVTLGGTVIGTSTGNSSGSYIVPTGSWIVNPGSTPLVLQFSSAVTNVGIVATFAEAGCPVLQTTP